MTVTLQTLTLQIFVGAYLMTLPRIGRKGSMLIGFGGYLVIGLVRRHSSAQLTPQIIGCAYDQLANIVPLFVIFVRQPLRWPPLTRPVWPPCVLR